MTVPTMAATMRRIYRDAATRGGLGDAELLDRFVARHDHGHLPSGKARPQTLDGVLRWLCEDPSSFRQSDGPHAFLRAL